MPALAHWKHWRETCALDLCGDETRAELRGFAHARFLHYAERCRQLTGIDSAQTLTPPAPEAWHLFETLVRLRNTRAGKAYKQWLFERSAAPGQELDAVQGGASLILRDVVREHLRREFAPRHTRSLDAPIASSGDSAPSLAELLPDKSDAPGEVEERDLARLAVPVAQRALDSMTHRERISLLARHWAVPVDHPAATRAAGCGKSVLASAYHSALQGIASATRELHPGEPPPVLATIAIHAMPNVFAELGHWGSSEPGCADLFIAAGRALHG